jgi:hypothetical protein
MQRTITHEALITLIEAREILDKSETWTRGENARTSSDRSCSTDNPDACKFCFIGAMSRSVFFRSTVINQRLCPPFLGPYTSSEVMIRAAAFCTPYLPQMQGVFGGELCRLINFNDREASYKDVISVLDKSIVDAKKAVADEMLNSN